MASTALIIEDDRPYAETLARLLQREGFQPEISYTGESGIERLKDVQPEVVLIDIGLPGIDGIEVTRQVTRHDPSILSIIVSGQATLETAVAAMRAGAFDFISKSSGVPEIQFRLRKALEIASLRRQVQYLQGRESNLSEIIGDSPVMRRVRQQIEEVAPAPITVLIAGETGTGKELVARAIHRLSERKEKTLVSVNCAAIPEQLLESEFFGHVRGAFTGADRTRRGLFELADGGSLFLDEVGELDIRLQAKLLRVIEERRFKRVGGEKDLQVDVRIIAATNRDLEQRVVERKFREDLLYRLNVFQIVLPPLRERGADVLLLGRHFIDEFNKQLGKQVEDVDQETARELLTFPFPGNIRQLRNVIEQAMIAAKGPVLTRDLFWGLKPSSSAAEARPRPPARETAAPAPPARNPALPALDDDAPLTELLATVEAKERELRAMERRVLERALMQAKGNKTKAAELLGISRYTFQRRLRNLEST
jgi:two-component system nitrogen regulation response regulator NtrX